MTQPKTFSFNKFYKNEEIAVITLHWPYIDGRELKTLIEQLLISFNLKLDSEHCLDEIQDTFLERFTQRGKALHIRLADGSRLILIKKERGLEVQHQTYYMKLTELNN